MTAHFLRRLRIAVSRSEWLARLLGLEKFVGTREQPGLVMVQIDGLSHGQMERAIANGELPFLKRLMQREDYDLQLMYAGVPATTSAVQAELFYGVGQAVPGFSYFDRDSDRLVRMIEPDIAAAVESELREKSVQSLLEGGSSYANNYTGGAAEMHFCPAAEGWGTALRDASPLVVAILIVSNLYSFLRTFALLLLETVIAFVDFLRGIAVGNNFIKELKFIPTRVAITILLRELVVIGAKIDFARGLPIVHMNLLGYDEQAHRRGPDSRFAHWTLQGIDDAIARLWRAAQRSQRRRYQLWVYSDHGQEAVMPYPKLYQRDFAEAVAEVFSAHVGEQVSYRVGGPWGAQLHRAGQLGGGVIQRLLADYGWTDADTEQPRLAVAALGPVAMIYWDEPLPPTDRASLARRIALEVKVPLVLYRDEAGQVRGWVGERGLCLPEDAELACGAAHPFRRQAAEGLARLCGQKNAGDFVVCGRNGVSELSLSFALENGAHGGAGPHETSAFALTPRSARLRSASGGVIGIGDLREAALRARRGG
ncbi:MAG: alkaline phosphatase family protein [Xanthomonadales bacterium]|nr:alkaline phosphatase family protein [Xanthomonadales bacterium]